jgi:hypothetical protein
VIIHAEAVTHGRKYAAIRDLAIYTESSSAYSMKRLTAIFGVAFLLLVFGCKKKEAFPPSQLFGDTFSGQSLQAVERKLHLRAGDWNVVEDQRSLSGGSEPPSRLYIISKPGFQEYGTDGELVLTFFNDELVGAKYFVADVSSACEVVEKRQNIGLCSGGEARIEPSTRVWVGKDTSGRKYLGWIDKQRQAALENWNAVHPK